MAQNGRKHAFRIGAGTGELVRVANAGGLDLDQNFACLRAFQINFDDFKRFPGLKGTAARVFMGLPFLSTASLHRGPVPVIQNHYSATASNPASYQKPRRLAGQQAEIRFNLCGQSGSPVEKFGKTGLRFFVTVSV